MAESRSPSYAGDSVEQLNGRARALIDARISEGSELVTDPMGLYAQDLLEAFRTRSVRVIAALRSKLDRQRVMLEGRVGSLPAPMWDVPPDEFRQREIEQRAVELIELTAVEDSIASLERCSDLVPGGCRAPTWKSSRRLRVG